MWVLFCIYFFIALVIFVFLPSGTSKLLHLLLCLCWPLMALAVLCVFIINNIAWRRKHYVDAMRRRDDGTVHDIPEEI